MPYRHLSICGVHISLFLVSVADSEPSLVHVAFLDFFCGTNCYPLLKLETSGIRLCLCLCLCAEVDLERRLVCRLAGRREISDLSVVADSSSIRWALKILCSTAPLGLYIDPVSLISSCLFISYTWFRLMMEKAWQPSCWGSVLKKQPEVSEREEARPLGWLECIKIWKTLSKQAISFSEVGTSRHVSALLTFSR